MEELARSPRTTPVQQEFAALAQQPWPVHRLTGDAVPVNMRGTTGSAWTQSAQNAQPVQPASTGLAGVGMGVPQAYPGPAYPAMPVALPDGRMLRLQPQPMPAQAASFLAGPHQASQANACTSGHAGYETDGGRSDADTVVPTDRLINVVSPSKVCGAPALFVESGSPRQDPLMFAATSVSGDIGMWSCFWLGHNANDAKLVAVVRSQDQHTPTLAYDTCRLVLVSASQRWST